MLYAAVALAILVVIDIVVGARRWRRLEARFEKLERVGILVTPDPKLKDAPMPMRMSPRQKIRYIEAKLRRRAAAVRGEA